MKTAKFDEMVKGWFVGAFHPTAYSTHACEVAVKKYSAGDSEAAHYHQMATEITMILSGSVKMFDKVWNAGDIIIIEPGEATAFEALSDTVSVVVKTPGALNDKFVLDANAGKLS
ncbi:MAG: cupin domain-containing protein [Rhodoferax sp.]|nr:cupin domain-containing protein [Rhodoferax sp.]